MGISRDFERKPQSKYFLSECCRAQHEHFSLQRNSNESRHLYACDHMNLGVNCELASRTCLSERV